jgi:AraC-like DNA-binding protein
VIACVIILCRYHLHGAEVKRELLSSGPRHNPVLGVYEHVFYTLLGYVQFLVYAFASLVVLRRYHSEAKEYYSLAERINISWLMFVIWGFIGWRVLNMSQHVGWMMTKTNSVVLDIVILAATVILSTTVVLKGLTQPEIFLNRTPRKKYEKSSLPERDRKHHLQKLLKHMEVEKPYLNPDVSLHSLAQQTSISPHHLSQIVNESLHRNFFDFVNGYRIKEAQRLLADPSYEHWTLLAILYEIGFSSKSAFNVAFKKHTGVTPSQFRKSVKCPLTTSRE